MAKSSKPKSVTVLGHKIKIVYHEFLEDLDGEFNPENMTIEIRDSENWKDHLLHEILHAVLFLSGTEFLLKENQIEAIVRALEHGLKSLITLKI